MGFVCCHCRWCYLHILASLLIFLSPFCLNSASDPYCLILDIISDPFSLGQLRFPRWRRGGGQRSYDFFLQIFVLAPSKMFLKTLFQISVIYISYTPEYKRDDFRWLIDYLFLRKYRSTCIGNIFLNHHFTSSKIKMLSFISGKGIFNNLGLGALNSFLRDEKVW